MKKSFTTLMLAASALMMSAQTEGTGNARLFGFTFDNGFLSGLADSGKWAVYQPPSYEEQDAIARRMNLSTGKIEELPLDEDLQANLAVCLDITDDGNTIVGMFNEQPAYYHDGRWTVLPMPEGTRGWTGQADYVSPDGEWMCGYVTRSFVNYKPALWHNGELVTSANFPTYDDLLAHHVIDRQTYDEHMAAGETPNGRFFKVSADGSKAVVGIDYNMPGWGSCFLLYDVATDTYDWLADDERGTGYVSSAEMCNSGEWLRASITNVYFDEATGNWDDRHSSVLYHVPTGTKTPGGGWGILDNNGVSYGGGASIPCDGLNVPIDMILDQKYGIDYTATTGFPSTGYIFAISSDTRTCVGMADTRLKAYSVTLPVPLIEAAKGVNLLAGWSASPYPTSKLSHIKDITLALSETSQPVQGAFATLLRDGSEIARTERITPTQQRSYVLSFPETKLEEGIEYTVHIDEGTFIKPRNPENHNLAIDITYTGRPDKALYPTVTQPLPGSAIMELSSYSIVSLAFDTFITKADEVVGYIYEKGNSDPICILNLAVEANILIAYPSTTRRLSLGREYEIRIPAGAVYELGGYNPCEEIVLNYRGSYVPKAPDTGSRYLFYDDFADPGQSLGNYLMFEGDHLSPISSMQAWGFDTDNTPWNLSVRDDDSYDYCAASHSNYIGGGRSDDWMVIPRLNITSDSYYLLFKSQSFRHGLNDRLKVYVWECDEDLGSLERATVNRILSEGKLIYDELESAGEYENILAGEWKENEIPLAGFNGKNIYIAFLNDNENQSAVFIDDVAVEYRGNYTAVCTTPASVIDSADIELTGAVDILGDTRYSSIKVECSTADKSFITTFSASGLNLGKGDRYTFTLPDRLPLTVGKITGFDMTIYLDGEMQTLHHYVSDMAFATERRVLLEEGTGTWCGFCPSGFAAIDYIKEELGDKVAVASIHFNDAMAIDSYARFLGFADYPTAKVNRRDDQCQPVYVNPLNNRMSFNSPAGNQTFLDHINLELDKHSESDISLNYAAYSPDDRIVYTNLDARPALDTDRPYNIMGILVEDGVIGAQSNNYTGNTDPLMADWANRESVAVYEYTDLVRAIAGTSYYGVSGLLPDRMKAGVSYNTTVRIALPGEVTDYRKCRVIMAIVDATDGRIINCVESDYLTEAVGVSDTDDDIRTFSAAGGSILFGGCADNVEVYTTDGRQVINRNLPSGIYIVRAKRNDNSIATSKIAI